MAKIRLQNLSRLHASISEELTKVFREHLENSAFIMGNPVKAFEASFAAFTGAKECVGVANGTDALEMSLEALGVLPGDKVIVPAMTFAATAEAVVRVGAVPVFADIDPHTGCLTVQTIEKALARVQEQVKAVILVHLYGRAADPKTIADYCRDKNLLLVEDCAQAQGAHVGVFGACGTFSFFPGKNLGALGDAGAVITMSPELAQRIRMIRDHGRSGKYEHQIVGRNSRLDALQAGFLSVKLRHLDRWNANRRSLAIAYSERLSDLPGIKTMSIPATPSQHVFHQYVILCDPAVMPRARLAEQLAAQGIETGIHYPIALHQQPAFAVFDSSLELPVSERYSKEALSLPLDPLMPLDDVVSICEAITRIIREG